MLHYKQVKGCYKQIRILNTVSSPQSRTRLRHR